MLRYMLMLSLVVLGGCNTPSLDDAADLANGVERRPIDASILGLNAFFNDGRFGSIESQFSDITQTLRLGHVRILFNWDDSAAPSPSSDPVFPLIDAILENAPQGTDALIIITGLPSWMRQKENWIDGDAGVTFVEKCVRPAAARYRAHPRVTGFQIWNEPNMASNPDNGVMGFADPVQYVAMLARASSVIRDLAPGKLVLNAATTAINQHFPETRDYNRAMRDAGAASFVDAWAAHYYGAQYENVIRDGGVAEFLNGLGKPIWFTESGAQGVNAQLPYGERTWPYLQEHIDRLERIYVYQYAEATAPESTYGLRNLSAAAPVSDLYVWLRDR